MSEDGKLYGNPRACKHCGALIQFKSKYDDEGKKKYLPANTDGSLHQCLIESHKLRKPSGRGVEDIVNDMAEAMGVQGHSTAEKAKLIGAQLGKTPAEVLQQAESLLKLEQLSHGNGSGSSGSDGTGDNDALDDLVDKAVEQALRAGKSPGGTNGASGEGSSGESAQSERGETSDDASGEALPDGSGTSGSENETGDPQKGSGTGESPEGNEESLSQPKHGNQGEAQEGKEGEAGKDESGEGEGKAGEKQEEVKVNKEILKRIAQQLKEQIKKETTQTEEKKLVLPDESQMDISGEHYKFQEFIQLLVEGEKPFLAGPAGSGKTTAALNAAPILQKVFEREDYQTFVKSFCLMSGKHELEGFIDANGVCQDTDFRTAFIEGHFFFMDEVDAANANILLVLNAAIENGIMSFPDGMLKRHEHFRLGAGANTVGLGADAQYSGRTQLDAAFRNRFYFMAWEYDEKMERKWAGNDQGDWVTYVQTLRAAQQSMGKSAPRVVISPRASIRGARRLRSGVVPKTVAGYEQLAEALIWQGCHEDDRSRIMANVKKKR